MDVDPLERHLFLEAIFRRYGYDFRQYSEASMDRRLDSLMGRFQFSDTFDFLKKIIRDSDFFNLVLPHLTVNTSSFFRDPSFFISLREKVLPNLRTYPTIRIWVAGCSTGEEAYSLAILLREEKLDHKTTIFATDINPLVLRKAREGIFTLDTMKAFARSYAEAGGKLSPSDYYTASYGLAKLDATLAENIVFSEHNLVTDGSFIDAHLILCRNVVIYFNRDLQDRVFQLFLSSLVDNGFLGLGGKETIRFSKFSEFFTPVDADQRIYQRPRTRRPK